RCVGGLGPARLIVVAVLPMMVQSMMESASLVSIKIIAPEIAREYGIIQRRDQAHRPVVVTFLSALQKTLAAPNASSKMVPRAIYK
ncbi:MAG: hypothetical protein ABW318_03100, partial [Vicinamibacterales bacterium]